MNLSKCVVDKKLENYIDKLKGWRNTFTKLREDIQKSKKQLAIKENKIWKLISELGDLMNKYDSCFYNKTVEKIECSVSQCSEIFVKIQKLSRDGLQQAKE